ncbi:putative secondary metabolism biosynthetic enzyme [Myotisia sp. PD_48]|nr:putative secondary metabolism biosynthetic enzyme [Myotisia sp. PD_48]
MTANDSKQRGFRVIVAGGGIAGLAMSHALSKANIDHVVLEKQSQVVYPSGASIGLWPNSMRFLDQIGCLDDIKKICAKMHTSYNRLPNGAPLVVSQLFDMITSRHGYEFLLIERMRFIKALYDNLPDKSKILTEKKITNVEETEKQVKVFLEDGTVEEGDILVGADGVHSTVRTSMWNNANKIAPGTISASEKRSLTTSYKCLFGIAPEIPGSGTVGEMTVIHNDGFSFLVLTQPNAVFFFVFIRLPETTRWPTVQRYTAEDVEAEAAKLADLPINENLLFGELWKRRLRGHLTSLEEGIFEHWHFGRTVLVGDSAHKMTPNIAFGANSALESVASLCNEINRVVKSHPKGTPTRAELNAGFQKYQRTRTPRVKKIFDLAAMMTRLQAWDGWLLKFVMRYIVPLVGDNRVADQFAKVIKGAVKLDYVPLGNVPRGSVKWEDNSGNRGQSEIVHPKNLAKSNLLALPRVMMIDSSLESLPNLCYLYQHRYCDLSNARLKMGDASHQFTVFKGTSDGEVIRSTTTRGPLQGNQVLVHITHSGLCGTDMHYRQAGCVLGHEGVGSVAEVGPDVKALKLGDRVGWGYLQNSCSHCKQCLDGQEIYCPSRHLYGFNNLDQGSMGFAAIWNEPFLFKIPDSMSSSDAAPLMCAGATSYSIFDQQNIKPTDRVGIIGLGGLGHVAVQISKRWGCETIVFSGTDTKKAEALSLGADEFYATKDVTEFIGVEPIDHLIVTTNAQVKWSLYLPILAPRGAIYPITVAFDNFTIPYEPLIGKGVRVIGSLVAAPAVHSRMIRFAAHHNIKPIIETFDMDEDGIKRAMDRLAEGSVRYRAVLVAPSH